MFKASDVVLVFLLLTFNIFHTFFSVYIVDFEQVNVISVVIYNPANIYLLKVNNRKTRATCEVNNKDTRMTPERRQGCRSGVFTVNFEHISHLALLFLLITLNM